MLPTSPHNMAVSDTQSTDFGWVDYLVPQTTSQNGSPENTFLMPDFEVVQDAPVTATMQGVMMEQRRPVGTKHSLDDLYMDVVPPPQPSPYGSQAQLSVEFERQLLHLQECLCDMPPASIIDKATGFEVTLGETTQASHKLLGIITGITTSAASSTKVSCNIGISGGTSRTAADSAIIFLVAACYARLLLRAEVLASRLQDIVGSGNEEAQRGLPCMQIGCMTSSSFVTPAVQTSMLLRLLSQSLRQIEKILPPLSRAVLSPPASVRGPFGDSLTVANQDIANVEAHVKRVLDSTLQMLK